jgi:peptidyl-prolyl cis-trans isomerase SurA
MKLLQIFLCAVVGASLQAKAASNDTPNRLVNGIKAVVHDSVITLEDVEGLTEQTADVLQRQYRGQPEVLQKKIADSRAENLDKLVARELILHEFKTAGYSLPESVIDDVVNERIKARYHDRAKLTATLQAEGMTYEKFRQNLRDQFIVEAMRQKNISSEIIISPHKIERYYADHRDQFKVEDEVKLRMLVFTKSADENVPSGRKLADDILAKINDGAKFAELAMYSQGSQRNQGGDWGWVERSVLRKELADAAFSLKPGEHSGVIETSEGTCYIMQVEDTRTSHYKTLGEVREEIEKNLKTDEQNRLEKQWIEKLRKKTFVSYF